MSKIEKLKTLLVNKYGVKEEDVTTTTAISDIVGSDKNLGIHIKDEFGTQPSVEEEAFETVDDVTKWLDK
nr:hypothetical protein [uncultured Pseudomonas sp.]